MNDAMFTLNLSSGLTQKSFSEIFTNKRVLVCTVNNPHNRVTQVYMKYLSRLLKKIKYYNIDAIYTINSFDLWSIPIVEKFFPQLVPLVNHDCKFVEYLLSIYNKHTSHSTKFLSEFWEYQVLLNNGVIEYFQQSSTENLENKVKESFYRLRSKWSGLDPIEKNSLLIMYKKILDMSRQVPQLVLRQPELYSNSNFSRSIRYQYLWPASNLLAYLEKQSPSIK